MRPLIVRAVPSTDALYCVDRRVLAIHVAPKSITIVSFALVVSRYTPSSLLSLPSSWPPCQWLHVHEFRLAAAVVALHSSTHFRMPRPPLSLHKHAGREDLYTKLCIPLATLPSPLPAHGYDDSRPPRPRVNLSFAAQTRRRALRLESSDGYSLVRLPHLDTPPCADARVVCWIPPCCYLNRLCRRKAWFLSWGRSTAPS